jgi:hypothetical protein
VGQEVTSAQEASVPRTIVMTVLPAVSASSASRPTTTAVTEEGRTRRRLHVTSPLPSSPTAPSRSSAWRRRPHRGYKTFDGLAFPACRRVYRRNRDGTPDRILAAITLDIDDITTA